MCGRFTITLGVAELQQQLDLGPMPLDWLPRFNVAPSQLVGVVWNADERNVEWMKWGLVPAWAKDDTMGARLINARAETLAEKPSFRQAFIKRRCLILADGFYEWKRHTVSHVPSTPYYFRMAEGDAFAFAGLWEQWQSPQGEPLRTCTIITTQANDLVKNVHDRMPVILERESCWQWLENQPAQQLQRLLMPFDAERMSVYPVARTVSNPKYDGPDCVIPMGSVGQHSAEWL